MFSVILLFLLAYFLIEFRELMSSLDETIIVIILNLSPILTTILN